MFLFLGKQIFQWYVDNNVYSNKQIIFLIK